MNTAKTQKLHKNAKLLPRFSLRLCAIIGIVFSLLFCEYACAPTYPKEKITSSIINMCRKECAIEVIAKTAQNTLGVYMALDNLLDQNFSLTKEASEKIGQVLLIIQRVVLSTNAPVEFYMLTVADKRLPSMEFRMTVYVKDIKRVLTLDISRGEYYERILRDLKLNLVNPANAGNFSVEPIKLSDFLAQQIALRLRTDIEQDAIFKVSNARGEFKEGHFLFILDISDKSESIPAYLDAEKNREILKESFKITDFVLRRYGFRDFEDIEIRNTGSKEVFRVKKEDLAKARHDPSSFYF